ncbi:CAM kinase, CDPK family, putative [Eimeria brunetti]|uniref:CAM kinase, CDPK family, putative n=1 Tax=Eimeria brunetti TaxID=51314 RepID=U6LAJ6_9EIME|nr:CAM kinase, CDPK family, putative [Eimeria brunetti]
MGAGQSLNHLRGRDAPVAGLSRIRGIQADARTSNSQTTILSDVAQQPQQNIIRYTSRLMRDAIGSVYSFDFSVLRREEAGKVCRVTCRRSGRKAEALVIPEMIDASAHVQIERLLEVFEDDRAVYLVSEYCPGGSLYDCLAALQKCPEEVAKTWTLQMVRAIGFLQGCGVVHRNLRLESWQLTSQGCFPPLKLYGLSHSTRWHKKEGRLNAACGLLEYTSPAHCVNAFICDCMPNVYVMSSTDVLLGRYTDACDMWSLGVIVYQLLCGRPPFVGTQQQKIRQILSGDVNWLHLDIALVLVCLPVLAVTVLPHSKRWSTLVPQEKGKAQQAPHPESQGIPHMFPESLGIYWALCCGGDFASSLDSAVVGSLFANASHSSVGRLTAEDLKRTLQREQPEPLGNEEVEDIFDALDINKDGEILFTVFAAAMIGTLVEAEDSLLQKAFTKLDVDCDGRLSVDDCRWAFGGTLFGQTLSAALEQEETEGGPLDFDHFCTLVREKGKPMHRRAYKTRIAVGGAKNEQRTNERHVHHQPESMHSNSPASPRAAVAGANGTGVRTERNQSSRDSGEASDGQQQRASSGCGTSSFAGGGAPLASASSPSRQKPLTASPN